MAQDIIKLNTTVISAGSVVGGREHEGPLGSYFDFHDPEDSFGMDTWEKAESEMQRRALTAALASANLKQEDIDALFAGDLLNQCVGSAYGLLEYDIPYFGLYGACSTAAEGILLASVMTSYGVLGRAAAVTSSHNCSAERQYRTPIEYGGQRAPTAQWTVTGSGAFLLGEGGKVRVSEAMAGIVTERGISDSANMGAAMAPAAISTISRYFEKSGTKPEDFDMILTGDLGYEGGEILCDFLENYGLDISGIYNDCGMMIYSRETQDVHSGGSGCGCSAVVLASYILPKLAKGELKNILFVGTGAMMSPSSIQQGLTIPAVAHLIRFESQKEN